MKGSDEELPLSMVEENAQGVGSVSFQGELWVYHEQFSEKKKLARRCHKRRKIFSMSEKDFIFHFQYHTQMNLPSLLLFTYNQF